MGEHKRLLLIANESGKVLKAVTGSPESVKANRYSRMSYAAGRLYYLALKYNSRAQLVSTDVTLEVDCRQAVPLIQSQFERIGWHNALKGRRVFASSTEQQRYIVSLHEGSKYARRFPWEFVAYKKAVMVGRSLIVKEMLY